MVCDHRRTIPVFQPGVVLLKELELGEVFTVFPVPKARRPGRAPGSGKGRGKGRAGGRGGAKAGPKRVGRPAAAPIVGGVAAPLPLEDNIIAYDEAQSESDMPSLASDESEKDDVAVEVSLGDED